MPEKRGRRDGVNLPPPDREAQRHSARLLEVIRAAIRDAGGALDFARYMELALYTPGLGYYSAGKQKFGRDGDFVTAPEISPLFSRCVARQCAEILEALRGDGGEPGRILEFGAGSGRMASDILAALEAFGTLPEEYLIIDLSAALRAQQRDTLAQQVPHLLDRVRWLETLPQDFSGVMLANEVLDAMPVHRVLLDPAAVKEYCVGEIDGRLGWRLRDIDEPRLRAAVSGILAQVDHDAFAAAPYVSEINLLAGEWIASVAASLVRGAVLLIDYGFPRHEFYHPDRNRGTLMCHYRHHAHDDPLFLPGLQDITAHVDFTAVAEAATASGLQVAGYTSQAAFLLGSGLMEWLQQEHADPLQQLRLAQQVKKLTLPHEMGELFKVMALTRGLQIPLCGFSVQDHRGRL